MDEQKYNPYNCVLELTNRCNLRCPHCASDSGCGRDYELTRQELQKVIADLVELGCRSIAVLGGEMLLRHDWFEICLDVVAAGPDLRIITNGILVDEEIRRKFLRLAPRTVCVSLDGASRETYKRQRGIDGFDRCLTLLHRLLEDGHRQVNAITTFSSFNIQEFDEFAKLFIDTGIVWQVQMVHKAGHRFDDSLLLTQKQYEFFVDKMTYYLNEYNGRLKLLPMDDFGYYAITPRLRFTHQVWAGCSAGTRTIGIRSNGDVLGCLSLGDDFIEANLREVPLKEIWGSDRYFRRFRHKETFLEGHCARCVFAQKCKAGCTAQAISNNGTLGDNLFCIRRLEEKRIISELFD
jgi:radical SAM protein with 4Fe4S-binding SPASM domain